MVTVIIPTFNRKEYLPRAIQSVLNQTSSTSFEVLVVDDGSTDGTEELFRTPEPRIRYERLPSNQGVNMARNRGLDLAKGEYVVFLDSDDELFPVAFEKALAVMETDAGIGMIGAPYVMEPSGKLSGLDRPSGIVPFQDSLCEIGAREQKGGFVMLRRSAIGDIRWEVPFLMFLFFRYVGKRTQMYYIAEPLGVYHFLQQAQSVTRLRKKPNLELSIRRSRALVKFLEEFGPQIIASCPRNYSWHAYGAAVGLLLDGKVVEARMYASRAMMYQKDNLRYAFFSVFCMLPFSDAIFRGVFTLKKLWYRS